MRSRSQLILVTAIVVVCFQGCSAGPAVIPVPFPAVDRIEPALKRGVSNKADVLSLLGPPAGKGSSVLPTDTRPREVWYYPDIEVLAAKSVAWGQRELAVTLRHQFLMAFFDKDTYDGFLWYSNVQDGENKERDASLLGRSMLGNIEYGWPPRTDPIDTLKVGISSAADVLLALGEPRGNGAVRFPVDPTLRQIWFYEQTRIDEDWRVHLKILLVFLRAQRYEGHIWFSSLQPVTERK